MAILSRSEFCEQYGITNANLSTYIGRKNLFIDVKTNKIDTVHPVNKTWIDKRATKITSTTSKKKVTNVTQSNSDDSDPEDDEIIGTAYRTGSKKISKAVEKAALEKIEIDSKKRLADLRKKELDADLVQLRVEQMKGSNISVDTVKLIISNLSKAFITNYRAYSEQLINEIAHEFGVPNQDRVRFLSKLNNQLNTIHSKTISDARHQFNHAIGESKTSVEPENSDDGQND